MSKGRWEVFEYKSAEVVFFPCISHVCVRPSAFRDHVDVMEATDVTAQLKLVLFD